MYVKDIYSSQIKFYTLTITTMTKHIKDFKWLEFGKRLCLWISKKVWRNWYEKCLCKHCWEERFVIRSSLLRWKSTYCWKRTKHWLSRDRIYLIRRWVYDRCNNKNRKTYKYYWWRWIKCVWDNFEEFYADMWDAYYEHIKNFWEKNTTIDRINSNWNYCKENCRWATIKEQANNTNRNKKIEYKWAIYNSMTDICEKLWINYEMLRARLNKWISVEDAIETGPIKRLERDDKWKFKKLFNYNI